MAIDYRKEGKIAIFTLNRPPVNAINMEVVRELREALMSFRDDPDLWVGIITGAGEKAFSAGADIKDTFVSRVLSYDIDRAGGKVIGYGSPRFAII